MRAPDDDIKEIWSKLTEQEQAWYTDFHRATKRHDWKALRRLCDLAPNADYDRLYKELSYEQSIGSRMKMPSRDHRKARYSEFDYGWEQPASETPNAEYVRNAASCDSTLFYKNTKVKFGDYND